MDSLTNNINYISNIKYIITNILLGYVRTYTFYIP